MAHTPQTPQTPHTPRSTGRPAHQNVTFDSHGSTAHGYLALPASGHGPGVIVIQEWWGLTDHIADVADRLAAEGFVALAPDLYGGNVAHDSGEAFRMMQDLPVERGVELLSGAVDHLLALPQTTSDTVGAVGFCMGGGFVLYLAAADQRVSAAVPFYGVIQGEIPDFSGLKAQILGHYGERDEAIPRPPSTASAPRSKASPASTPTSACTRPTTPSSTTAAQRSTTHKRRRRPGHQHWTSCEPS